MYGSGPRYTITGPSPQTDNPEYCEQKSSAARIYWLADRDSTASVIGGGEHRKNDDPKDNDYTSCRLWKSGSQSFTPGTCFTGCGWSSASTGVVPRGRALFPSWSAVTGEVASRRGGTELFFGRISGSVSAKDLRLGFEVEAIFR